MLGGEILMTQGVIIPLDCLDAHSEAFQWLDRTLLPSYALFGRLIVDAFFTPNLSRPTPSDLARAFFNLIQEFQSSPIEIPDSIMDHIEEASVKALKAMSITKEMVESQYGTVVDPGSCELQLTGNYDLYFIYENGYESRATFPHRSTNSG